jgi:phenylacetate-coenzyme A ligase PaaK-like adenylate-forming protein
VIEVRHYKLTLEKAQKTATAMQSINQLVAANPSLNAALDAGSGTTGKKAITQQAQDIDAKYPQIAAIIRTNGLTTREFIVATGALINDIGWVMMKKQGMVKDYPPGMITAENAALIEGNMAAFQEIGAKMQPPSTR